MGIKNEKTAAEIAAEEWAAASGEGTEEVEETEVVEETVTEETEKIEETVPTTPEEPVVEEKE